MARLRLRRRAPAVRPSLFISAAAAPQVPCSLLPLRRAAQCGVPAQGKECFSTGSASSTRDQSRSPPILEDYRDSCTRNSKGSLLQAKNYSHFISSSRLRLCGAAGPWPPPEATAMLQPWTAVPASTFSSVSSVRAAPSTKCARAVQCARTCSAPYRATHARVRSTSCISLASLQAPSSRIAARCWADGPAVKKATYRVVVGVKTAGIRW
jgi:hypothetical protein